MISIGFDRLNLTKLKTNGFSDLLFAHLSHCEKLRFIKKITQNNTILNQVTFS